jgi:hypothetical protein
MVVIVEALQNASTWPLENSTVRLIIKNLLNEEEVHPWTIPKNQSSFPFTFTIFNIDIINRPGKYSLELRIIGLGNQSLWHAAIWKQLYVNEKNEVLFVVEKSRK